MQRTTDDQLTPAIAKVLQEQWLPMLQDVRRQRQSMIRLMCLVILVPIVAVLGCLVAYVYLLLSGKDPPFEAVVFLTMLLGIPALAFVYLGKLQRCNDVLVVVAVFVHMRDRTNFTKALAKIECLGGLRGILDDARRLIDAAD